MEQEFPELQPWGSLAFTGGACPGSGVVLGLFFASRVQLSWRLTLETERPRAAARPAPSPGWMGALRWLWWREPPPPGGSRGAPRQFLLHLLSLPERGPPSPTRGPSHLHGALDYSPPRPMQLSRSFTVPLLHTSPKQTTNALWRFIVRGSPGQAGLWNEEGSGSQRGRGGSARPVSQAGPGRGWGGGGRRPGGRGAAGSRQPTVPTVPTAAAGPAPPPPQRQTRGPG